MSRLTIEKIKAQLLLLGFDTGVEEKLRCQLCFGAGSFTLRFVKQSGEDRCLFAVQVDVDRGGVLCYVASLQKAVRVSSELRALDERMSTIDWSKISDALNAAGDVVVSLEMIASASVLLQELRVVGDHALVLYKHWTDGPLASLVPGLAAIRSAYEISQRFYVVDGQPVITADEAFKFLQNKWMERKMVAERRGKALGKIPDETGSPSKKRRPRKK